MRMRLPLALLTFAGVRRLAAAGGATIAFALALEGGVRTGAGRDARVLSTDEVLPVAVARVTDYVTPGKVTVHGRLVASNRTRLYARAPGYVRRLVVNVGDHVQKGEIVAEIETPYDDQLAQARASLLRRQATLALAEARWRYAHLVASFQLGLSARQLVARQDADYAALQALEADANVASARTDARTELETVRQLEALSSLARVQAPFDGDITARLVSVGDAVAPTANAGRALFEVEATNPLRAFVPLSRRFVLSVHAGEPARVVVRQLPGQSFEASVLEVAHPNLPVSRPLETEILVPNEMGALRVGMDCDVTLEVPARLRLLRIPATAIVLGNRAPRVATIANDGRVRLVTVQTGATVGDDVEVIAGLDTSARLLAAPPADVTDGMQVATAAR